MALMTLVSGTLMAFERIVFSDGNLLGFTLNMGFV